MKKTEIIKLADGKDYSISTLNVGDLIEIEKKFGSLEINIVKTENMIYWLWLSIKKEQKDLTLEGLYELIDTPFIAEGKMNEIFNALSRVNGWDKLPKNVVSPAEKEQVSTK